MHRSGRSFGALVATGMTLAATAAFTAPPALADSGPVTVNASTQCATGSRVLDVTDSTGTALSPSNGLDASTGPASFNTAVTDTATCDAGFQVSATMSDLFGFDPTTSAWNCSDEIASTNVTLDQPTNPLSLQNISETITKPTFNLAFTGTLSGADLLLLGLTGQPANPASAVVGSITAPLTQANLGLPAGQLLTGVADALPVQIQPSSNTGTFTQADVAPATSGCSNPTGTASQIQVIGGTANGTQSVATGVAAYLQGLTGVTGTSIPVTDLVGKVLTQNTVLAALPASLLNVIDNLLPAAKTSIVNDLLGALSATYTGTASDIANLTDSGLYSAESNISVDTSGAPAGTYQGTLTVTIVNT